MCRLARHGEERSIAECDMCVDGAPRLARDWLWADFLALHVRCSLIKQLTAIRKEQEGLRTAVREGGSCHPAQARTQLGHMCLTKCSFGVQAWWRRHTLAGAASTGSSVASADTRASCQLWSATAPRRGWPASATSRRCVPPLSRALHVRGSDYTVGRNATALCVRQFVQVLCLVLPHVHAGRAARPGYAAASQAGQARASESMAILHNTLLRTNHHCLESLAVAAWVFSEGVRRGVAPQARALPRRQHRRGHQAPAHEQWRRSASWHPAPVLESVQEEQAVTPAPQGQQARQPQQGSGSLRCRRRRHGACDAWQP